MSTHSNPPFINVTAQDLESLVQTVRKKAPGLPGKRVTIGFDGFIDTIVKMIQAQDEGGTPAYFTTIESFGEYILEKKSGSFGIETETQLVKIGGNMPIMANALGRLGIPVNCLGALGYPQIHEQFRQLPASCALYSFAQPGLATAFEFNDGKILTADMGALHKTDWEVIKGRVPLEKIQSFFSDSDMVALLNWSEIDASTNIWEGLLKEVLPTYEGRDQFAFFDLSDCSKRSQESISRALTMINDFTKYARVVLSLNRNEAGLIANTLTGSAEVRRLPDLAEAIFKKLNIDIVLIHTSREVTSISKTEQVHQSTFFTDRPVLSTGAGDNFNAGFCTALLMEVDISAALTFASAASGHYVRHGKSGGISEILHLLENYSIH